MSKLLVTLDTRDAHTAVVFIQGSADIAGHDYLKAEMAKAHASPCKSIVVDIRKMDFVTSLGVGEFISLAKAKKAQGGKIALAGPNQYVHGVFDKARLSTVIPIFAGVDEAIAAVKLN
ncbi:MAG: STAS domain-containing protein [Phycisphaerales bacterium]|nr:STAS domain-containing protein [Phycisphaerales bacterium]